MFGCGRRLKLAVIGCGDGRRGSSWRRASSTFDDDDTDDGNN
jgi:hypothetical protein